MDLSEAWIYDWTTETFTQVPNANFNAERHSCGRAEKKTGEIMVVCSKSIKQGLLYNNSIDIFPCACIPFIL